MADDTSAECPVCFHEYEDPPSARCPVSLQCGHCTCRGCAVQLDPAQGADGAVKIPCPTCRAYTAGMATTAT